jgi:hypothetical protein
MHLAGHMRPAIRVFDTPEVSDYLNHLQNLESFFASAEKVLSDYIYAYNTWFERYKCVFLQKFVKKRFLAYKEF